ncbi:MAG: COG4705 family protein, partial [Streptosporangiaceae bacterium]
SATMRSSPAGNTVRTAGTAPTSPWTRVGALRVPQITAYFWVIKGLSTAMGEATSDWSVKSLPPEVAVLIGFTGFLIALGLQLRMRRYNPWTYWLAVCGVGVFGTMAADVLHVALHVPYIASSILYAVILAAVFLSWQRTERTLSIHTIDTTRRELFYWAAVVATFAMGTAVGDLTATTFHLGYFGSIWLFAGIILIPCIGFRFLHWSPILSFWFAYVITRPLGASVADWLSKPKIIGGLALGDGPVAGAFTLAIIILVAFLAITRVDVQRAEAAAPAQPAPEPPARPAQRRPPVQSWDDYYR